ncbi:uridine kinase [Nesterenkonia sp. E16_7]|uniref:uridine kinase n=1 Tax=unclassified Nesterenkonia TaxID=2629769 RepID=UPI001A90D134|nr:MULTISPECIES: uridine kinase [unclassified Nesterenkonia]MBO0594433.1 uridine kinase [Nesterenkonia sp. E16_10]MBO0598857.1 uridine kinase [Nesterenkonia sp. E16_7]
MDIFMRSLAGRILSALGANGRMVAVDGVDGSGKTCFAARLAAAIDDRPVILIHADDFLNLSPVRHAQGRHSPKGFWEDTYDYAALHEYALRPLGPSGDGWYRSASYDASRDQHVKPEAAHGPPDALVVLEGMFLHRDELASHWDVSVFLDVPFTETAARMSTRNGSNPDPEHPSMRRYVEGQRLYFESACPWERASFVVDNSDFTAPRVTRSPQTGTIPRP